VQRLADHTTFCRNGQRINKHPDNRVCVHAETLRPTHWVKYWEIIADNLTEAGWSWGCVSAVDSSGRTIFVVDVHRSDDRRFIVRVDEKLTAFAELESALRTLWTSDCTSQR
jgi:hypothetical protein